MSRNMRDQWKARIGAIENIQEEFGHDIREIKERLADWQFCLTNIRSRFWTKSWSTFFSSSSRFGSHDRSFNPSVVDEEPALAMGTFSFGIVVFPKFASFGVSSSCFGISTFVLDESSTSIGLSQSLNFSFPSLIRSRTLYLSAVQFFVGWLGFPPW